MPDFFPFIPGTETGRAARQHASDASPLLGRFRAVPTASRSAAQQLGLLSTNGGRGSVHVGYGALLVAGIDSDSEEEDDDDDDDMGNDNGSDRRCANVMRRGLRIWRRFARSSRRNVRDLWVAPRQTAVKRVVESWWRRWGVLVFLPAALVSHDLSYISNTYTPTAREPFQGDSTKDGRFADCGMIVQANEYVRSI